MPAKRPGKHEVCEAFITQLRQRGDIEVEAPGLLNSIREHFSRLPTRYALDVNIDGLDILSHKRLLEEARADPSTVSFAVRPVEIAMSRHASLEGAPHQSQLGRVHRELCRPAFGSSPNLQALALEVNEKGHEEPGSHAGGDCVLKRFPSPPAWNLVHDHCSGIRHL